MTPQMLSKLKVTSSSFTNIPQDFTGNVNRPSDEDSFDPSEPDHVGFRGRGFPLLHGLELNSKISKRETKPRASLTSLDGR